jgi:hypothetical protein
MQGRSSYARDEKVQEKNFRVQEYEETHFIHMMYKLFIPKFLPMFYVKIMNKKLS